MIEIQNLTYKFGDNVVVDNVSFTVGKGEIVAIIGPNGSGKTTLLRNIIGLYQPARGRVLINGQKPADVRDKIGYVPQRFDFDRHVPITITEFMGLERCGKQSHGYKNIQESLREVGLSDIAADKLLGNLSGGQFQRMMIARALLHKKEILIFDEPSSGIDIAGEKTIYDLIVGISKKWQTTSLIVSHEINVVNKYANKVICLNKKMVCFGKPESVINENTLKNLYGAGAGLYGHRHQK